MATMTIRVPSSTHARLQDLARGQDRTIGAVIETLLDDYERRRFFVGLGEDFERLRADSAAWSDYQAEVAAWDSALREGLAND